MQDPERYLKALKVDLHSLLPSGKKPILDSSLRYRIGFEIYYFASRAELIEAYAARSGRSVENVDFYQVLAHYKLAVIAEGIYARHLQGKTLGAGFEGMRRESVHVAERALELAAAAADPRLRGA